MRRAVIAIALTVAGLIPLLRYHPSSASTGVALPPRTTVPTTSAPPATTSGQAPAPTTSKPPSNGGTRTITGSEAETEFGPYQVQVTFSGNTITDVQLVETPGDGHSQRIAEEAAPTLRQEALQAQSAKIDTVSGATATSEAYAQSLQAAIDAAG